MVRTKLNLGHLSEEECEQILKVIQKDFDIRQLEKDRLASVEARVKEEESRMKILAIRQDFADKYCLICFKKFIFFFTPKTLCTFCKHYLCQNCISYDVQLKANICLVCKRHHEFLLQSNSWFYKRINEKFKRFGSAKIVRSLYKRKTDSDAESDSGYHPSIRDNVCLSESMAKRSRPNLSKVFEMDEANAGSKPSDEDEPLRTLSHFRQKLEAIEQQIRKTFIENRGVQQITKRSNDLGDDSLKKQAFNISLLLSSMTNEMTLHLNDNVNEGRLSGAEIGGDRASKEIISKYVLENCLNHICDSSEPLDDDDHPLGIDPEDLTLRGYIEQLSNAIVAKTIAELQSSEDKIFQDEEEKVKRDLLKLSNQARMSQIGKQLSDSELEDLPVTTDSLSDVDGREWQTGGNSAEITSASSFLKQGTTYPAATLSSSSEDPWMLSQRGPSAVMSNRIPIAPYDSYGKKKCGPVEAEGDLKMFLPKRHSIDGPMIDSMNVYELSDLSDGSPGSPFELQAASFLEQVPPSPKQGPPSPTQQTVNHQEEYLKVEDDNSTESLKPLFVALPRDVDVRCGEEFSCCCRIDGTKPIDVFWYRDTDELLQLGSDERCIVLHQGSVYKVSISNSQLSDTGLYHCVAVNEQGSCQHSFYVTVQDEDDDDQTEPLDANLRSNEKAVNNLVNVNQELHTTQIEDSHNMFDNRNNKGRPQPMYSQNHTRRKHSANTTAADEEVTPSYNEGLQRENAAQMQAEKYQPHTLERDHKLLKDYDSLATFDQLSDVNEFYTDKEQEHHGLSYIPQSRAIKDDQNLNGDEDITVSLNKGEKNKVFTKDYYTTDVKEGNESQIKSISKQSGSLDFHGQTDYNTAKNLSFLQNPEKSNKLHIGTSVGSVLHKTDSPDDDSLREDLSGSIHRRAEDPEVDMKIKKHSEIFVANDVALLETDKKELILPKRVNENVDENENFAKSRSFSSHLTSSGAEVKPVPEELKDTHESNNHSELLSKSADVQSPGVIDCGPPKVNSRRYSRDYEVNHKYDFPGDMELKTTASERRFSANRSHFLRSSNSLASDSDVFEQETSSANNFGINLSRTHKEIAAQKPKGNDLDEIVLPSVKQLRLKFSTPLDTSPAEALLRKKSHSGAKIEPELSNWKAAERVDPLFPSRLPISIVPLQPAPINSRSTSKSFSLSDSRPEPKSETKFQKEVIIRPQVVNSSQFEENKEEPLQMSQPQSSTVTGRVTIRPFSQRGHLEVSEAKTTERSQTK